MNLLTKAKQFEIIMGRVEDEEMRIELAEPVSFCDVPSHVPQLFSINDASASTSAGSERWIAMAI